MSDERCPTCGWDGVWDGLDICDDCAIEYRPQPPDEFTLLPPDEELGNILV